MNDLVQGFRFKGQVYFRGKEIRTACTVGLHCRREGGRNAREPAGLRAGPGRAGLLPIVTFTWILLYKNYPDAEKVKSFREVFQWCLLDGQKFAPQLG
jgi:ABC-type phosphate transport system substrate-binding protein